MPLALLALAVGAFGIGTTEFVMMGLLPNVADDLGTSVPTAGYLVSAYALGVVLGAPLLTAFGARIPRKTMLLLLMGVFTIGNLASALAPGFGTLLAGRVLAGLPHGAFFGVGAVVAARLVKEGRSARAVATMFLGLTVANIVGVPGGTALGQQLGWRATFVVVSVIGLVAMIALALLVPRLPLEHQGGVRHELRALGNRQVILGLLTAVFGFGGVFAVYSYLASMMTEVTGLAETSVTWVLALFGIGMTLGTLVAGPLTDRAPRRTLYAALSALAVLMVVFHFAAPVKWAALVLVGAAGSRRLPDHHAGPDAGDARGLQRADARLGFQPLRVQPGQRGRRVARRRRHRRRLGLDVPHPGRRGAGPRGPRHRTGRGHTGPGDSRVVARGAEAETPVEVHSGA